MTNAVRTRVTLASVEVGVAERRNVAQVLDSGLLAQGPMVRQLEIGLAEVCGTTDAVAVTNGTMALVAALAADGIGPGDEVVVPALTFGATLNAVLAVGATARVADVTDDFTVDVASLADLIGRGTAAVLPVHLYGLPADMASIAELARRAGVSTVEDNAQAIGATVDGRPTGSWGLGCLSLYATKNVAAGEGGAVTLSDTHTADRLRLLRNQGMAGRYEYVTTGLNWRMTDLHAAVGVGQLERIDRITASRRANAAALDAIVADHDWLRPPVRRPGRDHVFHQYVVVVAGDAPGDRSDLAAHLDRHGIDASPVYPRPVHHYDCFLEHPAVVADPTPVATDLSSRLLSIPVHPGVDDEALERIAHALGAFGT